jgi:hypothetical protein
MVAPQDVSLSALYCVPSVSVRRVSSISFEQSVNATITEEQECAIVGEKVDTSLQHVSCNQDQRTNGHSTKLGKVWLKLQKESINQR